ASTPGKAPTTSAQHKSQKRQFLDPSYSLVPRGTSAMSKLYLCILPRLGRQAASSDFQEFGSIKNNYYLYAKFL
ncbi:MAG: hypothetical protein R3Y08_07940, partial [Rikenellaceae bacterium]